MQEDPINEVSITSQDAQRVRYSHEVMVDQLIAELIQSMEDEITAEDEWHKKFNLRCMDPIASLARDKPLS